MLNEKNRKTSELKKLGIIRCIDKQIYPDVIYLLNFLHGLKNIQFNERQIAFVFFLVVYSVVLPSGQIKIYGANKSYSLCSCFDFVLGLPCMNGEMTGVFTLALIIYNSW